VADPDEAFGDVSALAGQERLPGSSPLLCRGFCHSENVAKLIAILATFSWTGHNQADVDRGGKADSPALTHTGQHYLDGTSADWQSRIKSISRTLLRFIPNRARFRGGSDTGPPQQLLVRAEEVSQISELPLSVS
jgi:hypothetical protein